MCLTKVKIWIKSDSIFYTPTQQIVFFIYTYMYPTVVVYRSSETSTNQSDVIIRSDDRFLNLVVDSDSIVSHFHSVKILLFSSARSRDFDGTQKLKSICAVLAFDRQHKKILAFSVKDRYQLNNVVHLVLNDNHFLTCFIAFICALNI
jgi:hypothetical protein